LLFAGAALLFFNESPPEPSLRGSRPQRRAEA